jgi:alginate O-acetyltransferase complex protein AlgI
VVVGAGSFKNMLFNSPVFLCVFLPVTYFVFWSLRRREHRFLWLTATGYVFYGWWSWKFCLLMAFSTLVSYVAGLCLLRWKSSRFRPLFLVVPISVDLALLGFFKYAGFILDSTGTLAHALGFQLQVPHFSITLPIGISFYTFHTITYIVDSYRGTITPTRNLFEFSCYVSLFSQLVAGPIVRFREVEADLENLGTVDRGAQLDRGWSFFCLGLAKKVLIADTLAAVINPALEQSSGLGTAGAWMCMLGYTYQLYFDFSGYSDMAVGLGHMFGIGIPRNFNSPYKASDPSDFWKRWHISLSSCLRDYLYIPLGGSRLGIGRTYVNLLATMLIGGLWHGANWTFVVWGAYHGLLLCLHRLGAAAWDRLPLAVRRCSMFLLVIVGWVFFRSESLSGAFHLLGAMFAWKEGAGVSCGPVLLLTIGVAAIIAHGTPNSWELSHRWGTVAALGIAGVFLVCLFQIYGGQPSPFLYFQF